MLYLLVVYFVTGTTATKVIEGTPADADAALAKANADPEVAHAEIEILAP